MDPASSDHQILQGHFASLHASETDLRVDDARSEGNHQRRHEGKMWTARQQEHGIISRLFVACLQSLQCIVQDTDSASLPKRDLNNLRRTVSTLLLWGDGYGARTGALDTKLKCSRHLHRTTLSLFRSLCGTLRQGLTEIVPCQSDSVKALALRTTCRGLYDETKRVLAHIRQNECKNTSDSNSVNDSDNVSDNVSGNDTDEDSDSDTDEKASSSGDQTKLFWFTSFVADVLLYTSCLTDLGTALECPALHHEHNMETEPIAICANQAATETRAQMEITRVRSTMRLVDGSSRDVSPSITETAVTVTETSIPIDTAEPKIEDSQQTPVQFAVPVSKRPYDLKPDDLHPMIPISLLDSSYEETFAALDANSPFTLPDLEDLDHTWATRSRPATPDLSTSNDTPLTRQSDVDCFDAWMLSMKGDKLPLDMQLRDDLQTLGVTLAPMDDDEMTLFPSLVDFDAMEKRIDGSKAGPEGLDDIPRRGPLLPHGSICNNPVDISPSLGNVELEAHERTKLSPVTTMRLNRSDLHGDDVDYLQNQQTSTDSPVPLPCVSGTRASSQSANLEKDDDRLQLGNHGWLIRTSFETPEALDDHFQSAHRSTILATNSRKTDINNTFKCKDSACRYSVRSFYTKTELDAHISIAHTVHDNPLQFALESMANYLEVDAETGEPKTAATASKPTARPAPAPANTGFQQYSSRFARPAYPPVNPSDQNLPCNTLYVGNLPRDTDENELKAVFAKQRGYKRLCFRTKQNGPMCFVEFEDPSLATKALNELYGYMLKNSTKGGIRLSFSKNPLGLRANSHVDSIRTPASKQPTTAMLPPLIPARYEEGYGALYGLDARMARPFNACAREQHSTDVTSADSRTYGGKSAVVVHNGGGQKYDGASNNAYWR